MGGESKARAVSGLLYMEQSASLRTNLAPSVLSLYFNFCWSCLRTTTFFLCCTHHSRKIGCSTSPVLLESRPNKFLSYNRYRQSKLARQKRYRRASAVSVQQSRKQEKEPQLAFKSRDVAGCESFHRSPQQHRSLSKHIFSGQRLQRLEEIDHEDHSHSKSNCTLQ